MTSTSSIRGDYNPTVRASAKGEVAAGSSSWRVVVDDDLVLVYGPYSVKLLAIAAAAEKVLGFAVELWERGLRENVDNVDDAAPKQS